MFRFAILVAGAMAMSDPTDMKPSCSERGKAYVTADKISSGPDGLYVINAISCQQSCAANPTCKKFTWKGDTTPLKGGCWLVSDADAEVRDDPMAISGPRLCPAAASSFRRSGPIAISDMGKSGAKDLHDADSLGGKDKTLVAGASTVSKRSDAATFLLGLLAIAGVVGAIFGIAGATYFLAARKPKKTRALKAAPQDEERPIMDETPMPTTSSMPSMQSMPFMQAPMPVPAALTAMPLGPMAQMQPIQYPQYYQPLHIMPPQFAGKP